MSKSSLRGIGIKFEHEEVDRTDVAIDFRLLGGLLKAAADPEVSIASFARGGLVGRLFGGALVRVTNLC